MGLLALPWSLKVVVRFAVRSGAAVRIATQELPVDFQCFRVGGPSRVVFLSGAGRRALGVVHVAVAADDRHRVRRRAGRCADGGDRSAARTDRSSAVGSVDRGERCAAPHRCRWRISQQRRPTAGGAAAVRRAVGGELRARLSVSRATRRTFEPARRSPDDDGADACVRTAGPVDGVRHSVRVEFQSAVGVGAVSAHDARCCTSTSRRTAILTRCSPPAASWRVWPTASTVAGSGLGMAAARFDLRRRVRQHPLLASWRRSKVRTRFRSWRAPRS